MAKVHKVGHITYSVPTTDEWEQMKKEERQYQLLLQSVSDIRGSVDTIKAIMILNLIAVVVLSILF